MNLNYETIVRQSLDKKSQICSRVFTEILISHNFPFPTSRSKMKTRDLTSYVKYLWIR